MYRVSHHVRTFGLALAAGVGAGMVWANVDPQSYADFSEFRIAEHAVFGYPNPEGGHVLTLQALAAGVLLPLYVFSLGKELWEEIAPAHGALRGRRALLPLLAAAGASGLPVLLYLLLGGDPAGWPAVMAGDTALAYLIGRASLGPGHPVLRPLLLAAILGDLAALLIGGLVASVGGWEAAWLLLPLAASTGVWLVFNRLPRALDRHRDPQLPISPAAHFLRRLSVWPYVLAGVASWYGTTRAGLMPALGLLPVIPAIPHADRAFGVFAEAEEVMLDPLNRIAHLTIRPVALGLFLFGLTSGGAEIGAAAPLTWACAAAMLLGRPAGLLLGLVLGGRLAGTGPVRLTPGAALAAGLAAAAGLAVPLALAATLLPGGETEAAARLGLVLSLVAAPLALLAGRLRPRR